MRFANFDLDSPIQATILVGLGHHWDVHNFADLVAAAVSEATGTAYVEWRVPANVGNPWGSPGNCAAGCRLVFEGVRSFQRHEGKPNADPEDARTVLGISKTIPGAEEYPFKRRWEADDPFCLRIETEASGRIDVDAELATLEPIPRLDG
jgi:hypothetical protein